MSLRQWTHIYIYFCIIRIYIIYIYKCTQIQIIEILSIYIIHVYITAHISRNRDVPICDLARLDLLNHV